jgi:hypothetical protein
MREQWLKESDAIRDSAIRSYKENNWADAILLRNELYRRLPKKPNQKDLEPIYQNPTNVLGVQLIADHLELIAAGLVISMFMPELPELIKTRTCWRQDAEFGVKCPRPSAVCTVRY